MKKLNLPIRLIILISITNVIFFWIGLFLGSKNEQFKLKNQGYFPISILQRTNAYYQGEIEKIREACFNQL